MNLLRHETGDELVLLVEIVLVHSARRDLIHGEVRLAAGDGFDEGVVQEDVLLLGLHEEVALRANVSQKAEDV